MNLLPFVTLARDENPKPLLTADEVAACLYRAAQLAQAAGRDVGVLLKPHGAGGMSPVGRISLDILIDIAEEQEYDAFNSADGEDHAPGPAIPTWRKLPYRVGKCWINPESGKEECSGASMDRVRRPLANVPGPTPDPVPPPVPPPPIPAPVPLPALGPAQPYTVMEPFGLELGALLGVEGSPYRGNLPAVAQVAVYLTHNIQFHGWTLEQARADARARAAG